MEYKVLKPFLDKHTGDLNKIGDVIEISDERFEEIKENAVFFSGIDTFLEQIDSSKSKKGKKK